MSVDKLAAARQPRACGHRRRLPGEGDGVLRSHQARVLVVEDDPLIRSSLEAALHDEGYRVRAEADGCALREALGQFRPDLVILDVRLPAGPDGYALARTLRAESDVPILFLTADDSLDARLAGFDVGADDFLAKPFSMAELLARARALLRRAGRLSSEVRQLGDLIIDDRARVVVRGDHRIELTPTEYNILYLLTRNPGKVVPKERLLSEVWGLDAYETNRVEVQLHGLRRKLEAHGPRLVHTVRQLGYVFRP